MVQKRNTLLIFSLIILGSLAACNLPAGFSPTAQYDATHVIQTVNAQVTRLAAVTTAAQTDLPQPTRATGQALLPSLPAATGVAALPPAQSAATSAPCDRAAPGQPIDVTIPDDTRLRPGEPFSKTWRLINHGSCTWSPDYAVVWFSGEEMGVINTQPLNQTVAPQQAVDITVDMVAPRRSGTFRSNWKMRNAKGELFGIGPNGDSPFWVRLEVVDDSQPTEALTATVMPTQVVAVSGLAVLTLDSSVDLDSGQIGSLQDDLALKNGDAGLVLIPLNGARVAAFGMQVPDYAACQTASLGQASLRVESLEEGTYLCYRSSKGQPGLAQLVLVNVGDAVLNLDFVTWALP